jgi:ABC-type glycerol-3-phosphate transport system substrate-binding protein
MDELDEEISFRTESAWSPPEAGVAKILEEIEKVDPNVIGTMVYDDEMPNFVGWSLFHGSELEDGGEWDDEEIREEIFYAHPHLKEHWDESNDEWQCDEDGDMTQEAYDAEDEYRDVMYEICNDMQDKGLDEAMKFLKERLEEEKE